MANATPPIPTPIYRLVHIENLPGLIQHGALCSPNRALKKGLAYRTIHNVQVQASRRVKIMACGPGGTIHDYVPFYFGPRSPMLLNLKTGRVEGYTEGQAPLIYLVTTVQIVESSGARYVFSDGHGLAAFTQWYDDLAELHRVDWEMVAANYWPDTSVDNDRQRRKQAEFLVWEQLEWGLIRAIGVSDESVLERVKAIIENSSDSNAPKVFVKRDWYY